MSLACSICTKAMDTEAMACPTCGRRLDSTLVDIGQLHAELPDHLEPEQGRKQRVSGSREAPLPLRVDPLDLSLPVWAATVHEPPCTCTEPRSDCRPGHPHHDQTGHLSVMTILDSWVRDWCDTRAMGEHPPTPGMASVTWLRNRLDWACSSHPAIDEFDAELRQLRGALRLTLGVSEIKPELLDVPCRRCEWRSLSHLPGQDRVECGHCGDLSSHEEHTRWMGLLVAGIQDGVVGIPDDTLLLGEEAATLARVKPELIRQWASRGLLPVAERTKRGRPQYRAGDVRHAKDPTVRLAEA